MIPTSWSHLKDSRDCQQLTGTGHSEMLALIAETFQTEGAITE